MSIREGSERVQFSIRPLMLFIVVCSIVFAVVGWCVSSCRSMFSYDLVEEARKSKETEKTIMQLVEIIEARRAETGAIPENQPEMEDMLGRPMPTTGWDAPIMYTNQGGGRYMIDTVTEGWGAIIYQYHSGRPQAGVEKFPF